MGNPVSDVGSPMSLERLELDKISVVFFILEFEDIHLYVIFLVKFHVIL